MKPMESECPVQTTTTAMNYSSNTEPVFMALVSRRDANGPWFLRDINGSCCSGSDGIGLAPVSGLESSGSFVAINCSESQDVVANPDWSMQLLWDLLWLQIVRCAISWLFWVLKKKKKRISFQNSLYPATTLTNVQCFFSWTYIYTVPLKCFRHLQDVWVPASPRRNTSSAPSSSLSHLLHRMSYPEWHTPLISITSSPFALSFLLQLLYHVVNVFQELVQLISKQCWK